MASTPRTIEVTIFTGIETTAYRGVQLFPNPAADRITLDGMTGNDNDLTVRFPRYPRTSGTGIASAMLPQPHQPHLRH